MRLPRKKLVKPKYMFSDSLFCYLEALAQVHVIQSIRSENKTFFFSVVEKYVYYVCCTVLQTSLI